MEDIRTAVKLMSRGCYMATTDLQDAYFMISICKEHRSYLRFRWRGQIYEFVCLPFGLSCAPWVFTKVMKPIMSLLRSKGYLSTIYIDDCLCLGATFAECVANVKFTTELFCCLGFIINNKSPLTPAQKCNFLGFHLNSVTLALELPSEKKGKILDLIKKFRSPIRCKIRDFAQFLGTLTAACPAMQYGWAHTKSLEREKYLALLNARDNYEARMHTDLSTSADLSWWESVIGRASNPIRSMVFCGTIFSDASGTGWGAACEDEVVYGNWDPSEAAEHINYLELLAAFRALESFASDLVDAEILLRIDSTTAIAYINRMGGTRYPKLNSIAQRIWSWCETRRLWIFDSYIPSRENTEADQASRMENIDTEWELAPWAYYRLYRELGKSSIDLFASTDNHKCENYCSWFRDPKAFCVNAFTFSYSPIPFYAFPPFSLILRVLRKIVTDQACGVVVVSDWSTQPWYPLWLSLLLGPSVMFKPDDQLFLSPCRKVQHPLAGKLTMLAGLLSARPSDRKV
ncbi:uncharacterized protein LOC103577389 [Microplitis demolitor]|uniref:uncharacterized protein LOC103577389 n=1 Tax=Microplitis demolitor TaxID=69319 RepID=UPI0004CD8BCA|nr:uncharacterized protein LOC103577389 [Microplitis demolitor]